MAGESRLAVCPRGVLAVAGCGGVLAVVRGRATARRVGRGGAKQDQRADPRRDRTSWDQSRDLPGDEERPHDHDQGVRRFADRRAGHDQHALPQRGGRDLIHDDAAASTGRRAQGQTRRQDLEVDAEPPKRQPCDAAHARVDDGGLSRLRARPAPLTTSCTTIRCTTITTQFQMKLAARSATAVHARHELQLRAQQLRDPRARSCRRSRSCRWTSPSAGWCCGRSG